MIRKAIDESLRQVELDGSGRTKIWNRIQELERSGTKEYMETARLHRRPLRVVAAVFLLILAFSVICIAAELPSKLMDLFEPVNKKVVYDGIEMRIVSAVADDDSMMILCTLRDLTGSRISKYTSIYDFSLSRATTLGASLVDYDEETKTATFCMAGNNGEEMKGRELTMSIGSFLNRTPIELRETNLNVYDLLQRQAGDSGATNYRGYNAAEENSYWNAQNKKGAELQERIRAGEQALLLSEGSMNIVIPGANWVTITNLGYKDGWLHVRAKYDEEKSEINNGYICLSDAEGNELDNAVLNTSLPGGSEEFIIRAGKADELKDVYLAGVFTNYDSLHTGEWQTTFKVKGVETKSFACTVETDSVIINRIVLSPLGVTVYGKGTLGGDSIRIHRKDGTDIVSEGFGRSRNGGTGEFECKYIVSAPIDIQTVDSISLEGQRVAVP